MDQEALTQTEDEINIFSLRLENIESRFKALENEVSQSIVYVLTLYLFHIVTTSRAKEDVTEHLT